jgi:hypothetical protein
MSEPEETSHESDLVGEPSSAERAIQALNVLKQQGDSGAN